MYLVASVCLSVCPQGQWSKGSARRAWTNRQTDKWYQVQQYIFSLLFGRQLYIKYTNPARGILDLCKQKFQWPLLPSQQTLYCIRTPQLKWACKALYVHCNLAWVIRILCNTSKIFSRRARARFWLWIMKVTGPSKTLHILNAEVVLITEWGAVYLYLW